MSKSKEFRFLARLGSVCLVSLLIPMAQAEAIGQEAADRFARGGSENPLEVVLPFEMQARFFHSLPIAGLMVTPDDVAQLVLMNPRLRVTTGWPISGKGIAIPIDESDVVDTPADPID